MDCIKCIGLNKCYPGIQIKPDYHIKLRYFVSDCSGFRFLGKNNLDDILKKNPLKKYESMDDFFERRFELMELIGSTKGNNVNMFKDAEKDLTNKGYIVFKPVLFGDEVDSNNLKMLTDMCYEKMLVSDAVCIVTPNHIGESTLLRITQALDLNKQIYIWENGILYAHYKFNIIDSKIVFK